MFAKHPRVKNPKLLTQMKKEIGHCEYYGPDFNFECLEAAHIEAKGMGGGKGPDIRENIVILSGPASFGKGAHGAHHRREITNDELYVIAARREGISVEECKAKVKAAMGKTV
ncbi:hypothetical protein [Anaeroselena agilis]|uniref:HNH endonuclease n=1 Tax=Anaeroselena agilis TaxID=3063788 RepID=A0ABU3NZZ1_9FIRM|nr:hypothetical protein [Selenomonadales bacterium 4137-cl]